MRPRGKPVGVHQVLGEAEQAAVRQAVLDDRPSEVGLIGQLWTRRLIGITAELARRGGREPGEFEYQMLFGARADEQSRLAAAGHAVWVYLPFGPEWYGYFTRRLAERPANTLFFLRALAHQN